MQNHLTTVLQQLYEANLRCLQQVPYERNSSKRLLNTNDYIINALTTLMSRRYGMILPNLNSEESPPTTFLPVIPPPPPQPQMFATAMPGSMFHDPVPVFPSPAQIREGIRDVTFSSIENPINDTCPILLSPFQPSDLVTQIRGCGHIFGQPPIRNWFRTNCRCPVCRFDIRNYVAGDNLENENNNQAVEDYETTFSQNATAILNLLSNPASSGAVVRDLSGNSFIIAHDIGEVIRDFSGNNFMIRSFYDT
jgi:hypothetical protein